MKTIFVFCLGIVFAVMLNNVLFVSAQPVQAQTQQKCNPAQKSNHKKCITQPVELPKDIYYTAFWQSCLTNVVFDHPEFTDSEIIKTCKERLQIALNNRLFENRYSDMFQPLPVDIYLGKK